MQTDLDSIVLVEITLAQALVLLSYGDKAVSLLNGSEIEEKQSLIRCIWDIKADIESKISEVFAPNYNDLLIESLKKTDF